MSKPKHNIGDEVVAVIKGRVTAITEYANGYFSYRVTGTEPTGDRYNKFIDEQFVERALMPAANDNDIPLPAAVLQRAAA